MQLRSIRSGLLAGAVVLALAAPGGAAAKSANAYTSGFEPNQGYSAGPLNGQDGWSGAGVVQSDLVDAGRQALLLQEEGGFRGAQRFLDVPIARADTAVRYRYYRSDVTGQAGLSVSGDTGFIVQAFTSNGSIGLGNRSSSTARVPFAAGLWHEIELRLDFEALTVTGFLDGVPFATIAINNAEAPTAVTAVQLYTFGSGGAPSTSGYDQIKVLTTGRPLR